MSDLARGTVLQRPRLPQRWWRHHEGQQVWRQRYVSGGSRDNVEVRKTIILHPSTFPVVWIILYSSSYKSQCKKLFHRFCLISWFFLQRNPKSKNYSSSYYYYFFVLPKKFVFTISGKSQWTTSSWTSSSHWPQPRLPRKHLPHSPATCHLLKNSTTLRHQPQWPLTVTSQAFQPRNSRCSVRSARWTCVMTWTWSQVRATRTQTLAHPKTRQSGSTLAFQGKPWSETQNLQRLTSNCTLVRCC